MRESRIWEDEGLGERRKKIGERREKEKGKKKNPPQQLHNLAFILSGPEIGLHI